MWGEDQGSCYGGVRSSGDWDALNPTITWTFSHQSLPPTHYPWPPEGILIKSLRKADVTLYKTQVAAHLGLSPKAWAHREPVLLSLSARTTSSPRGWGGAQIYISLIFTRLNSVARS